MRTAWLPRSTTRPCSITTISSACTIVLNLCAMMIVVLPLRTWRKLSMTRPSVYTSNADVASSHNKIGASFTSARARATRCRCPPLKRVPLSPTCVARPCSRSFVTDSSCAHKLAAKISSSLASGRPYLMLYARSSLNSEASCCTRATQSRTESPSNSATS
mmetsp:Transcript_55900/g.47085  ORF Transcript_55900/g.47085 Transcript_55900/m.47085 type:complete len:161 (-) Transcript_55900:1826-2308(-)